MSTQGTAEVLQLFPFKKAGQHVFTAAGLNVLTGMLKESTLNTVFRVTRNGETVAEVNQARLQLFGEVVHEVHKIEFFKWS